MSSAIRDILKKIDNLNAALRKEYDRLAKENGFSLREKRIVFLRAIRARNKALRIPSWRYLTHTPLRHWISAPFIYIMIIPLVITDVFVSVYHAVAFPLYGIPKIRRRDYIVYDRRFLDYLNWVQKINCLYCSYANGLIAYAGEIAARTERYWCPIKAASKPATVHTWYHDFADYGNPTEWHEKFNNNTCFTRKKDENDHADTPPV